MITVHELICKLEEAEEAVGEGIEVEVQGDYEEGYDLVIGKIKISLNDEEEI